MAKQIISLNRAGVSVLIETTTGTPNVFYWGDQLAAGVDPQQYLLAITEPAPHGYYDFAHRGGAWRENARGFWGRPSLLGHRDGKDWSQLFELIAVEESEHAVTFTSADLELGVQVSIKYSLDASGLLLVDHSVTNLAAGTFFLENSTVFLPVPDHASDLLDFTGRWLKERQPQRTKIQTGIWQRESREGRSGHDYTLVQFAMTAEAGFQSGQVWGLSVAWSGDTNHVLERQSVGRTQIGAGELLMPGEVTLEQGETYQAPTVIAAYANNGIDGASARFHEFVRSRAIHPTNRRPRPVTLNVWEAVYMDHKLDKLSALAEVAGQIGVERFVLDDGWFGARRDDHAGLGDWVVAPEVWPQGLQPLIDVVKENGMEFGLWFEGEMVNADSDLYRAHPDWILKTGNRVPIEARFQQVLDLSHQGAFEHVLGQVDALLNEYDIRYIKWDHNRTLTDAAHFGKATMRNQTLAIYRLFDELKRRHPGLEIESCASGGGRIDLGMVEHADRFWTSDCNDALERQTIQRYTSIVIPPELLGTHIGPTHAHSTGRTHELSFRAITALFGHAGLEWDLTETTADERATLKAWTDYYKANRELLHGGRTVRVDQTDATAQTYGVVSHDGSRGIFAHVTLAMSQFALPPALRLAGLDAQAKYHVKLVQPAGGYLSTQKFDPEWINGVTVDGGFLMNVGLRAPILKPENAFLLEVTRA
ncbi:MAG: alpha-galactosidase [Micrococcales bacterium]